MIERAELPTNFEAPYSPLPSRVEFKKLISNILNSIKFLNLNKQKDQFMIKESKDEESKAEKWSRYLQLEENIAVVSDAFWYSIAKFFNPGEYREVEEKLLARMSKNYISLFLSINDKADNHLFFKEYFDVLSQAVFYAFFYAYPLSRIKFNDALKKKLLDVFSELFTGVKISNTEIYLSKWNLDLGAGNIFKMEAEIKQQK